MKLRDYLVDRIDFIFVNVLFVSISILLLYLFNINGICFLYISVILFFLTIYNIIYDYLKKRSFYNLVEKTTNNLDKKYLLTDIIDCPTFLEGKLLYDYLYFINKNMLDKINEYKLNSEEFREYIEMWCHEIKTPISTSHMIITNNKNKTTESINEEIDKINNYVEQVLFYSRSNNVDKDYIINEISFVDVVNKCIKNNKKELIGKKIKVNIDVSDTVYSDDKWLEFIINQIIENSIKYDTSVLEIKSIKNKNNVELAIKDNGIGINKDELDKVFDKGFTGSNGRKKYNSTGIGLYLCKKLCTKLGHNIFISSVFGKETIVTIIFPISSSISDVKR